MNFYDNVQTRGADIVSISLTVPIFRYSVVGQDRVLRPALPRPDLNSLKTRTSGTGRPAQLKEPFHKIYSPTWNTRLTFGCSTSTSFTSLLCTTSSMNYIAVCRAGCQPGCPLCPGCQPASNAGWQRKVSVSNYLEASRMPSRGRLPESPDPQKLFGCKQAVR